jgi:hypothetical protein
VSYDRRIYIKASVHHYLGEELSRHGFKYQQLEDLPLAVWVVAPQRIRFAFALDREDTIALQRDFGLPNHKDAFADISVLSIKVQSPFSLVVHESFEVDSEQCCTLRSAFVFPDDENFTLNNGDR